MTDKDIVIHLQRLFEPTVSPGQAFDALFKMRQDRVTWEDAYKAVTTHGKALQTLKRTLDETDDGEAFQCPGCGVARTSKDYCINPACPEHKPNPETERIRREAAPPSFRNPKPSFGPYNGKTLTEIAAINPGYLAEMAASHESAFWREQAKLAQIYVDATSPAHHDPSDTGFFR